MGLEIFERGELPRWAPLRQQLDATTVDDVAAAVAEQFARPEISAAIRPGITVAEIDRWNAEAVRQVFHAAQASAQASFHTAEVLASLRAQQARWTRGSVETARKLLARLWQSDQPLPVKVEGTFHLSGHFVFPFLLLISLLHAPLVLKAQASGGASGEFCAVMALGVLGFGGFLLSHALAQRDLYHDWLRRLTTFPLFLAASLGISLSNTIAVIQGLARTRSTFARTPKLPRQALVDDPLRYRIGRFPLQGWIEALLAIYTIAGLGALLEAGAWASIPFQAFFAFGFLLVALASLDAAGLRSQRKASTLASS